MFVVSLERQKQNYSGNQSFLNLTVSFINSGNEVVFSLETASDYVKDDKACFYGFKCTVVGYEWAPRPEEVHFSYLLISCMCAISVELHI